MSQNVKTSLQRLAPYIEARRRGGFGWQADYIKEHIPAGWQDNRSYVGGHMNALLEDVLTALEHGFTAEDILSLQQKEEESK